MSKQDTFQTEQLTDSAYYILLSLLEERHGYIIMKYIGELTNGEISIGPATLYTVLKKMIQAGWIEQASAAGERTKQYRITPKGNRLLKNEISRRKKMVEDGEMVFQRLENEEEGIR